MVNIIIDNMIKLKKDELSNKLLRLVFDSYKFKKFTYGGNYEQIKLFTHDKYNIYLPPNISFLKTLLELQDIEYTVEDKRFAPHIDVPMCTFTPQLHPVDQNLVLEMIVENNYDCMLTLPTGAGKNTLALYLANYLKTPCLYIASKVTHIENFKNELSEYIENIEDHMLDINSNWLKGDKSVKAYNLITTRSLSNLDIANGLKNQIGLIITDEFHKHITAEKTRNGFNKLNAKYRLFLSATPETKIKGLTSAALCASKVHIDDKLEFNINFQKIVLNTMSNQILELCYDEYTHFSLKKKSIYIDETFLDGIAEFIYFKVNIENKGIMIHNDSKDFHSKLHHMLTKKYISSAIINSNTKKENIKDIFKDFENKKIDVLISGASMEEGVSLYRLSCLISTCVTVNSNMFVQLIGRLKRYDKTICDKQKEFILLTYDFIASNNYMKNIEPNLEKLSFINKLEDKQNIASLCMTKVD